MRHLTFIFLLLALAGCATAQREEPVDKPNAGVLEGVLQAEKRAGSMCKDPHVLKIEKIPTGAEGPTDSQSRGKFVELWHLDRCGEEVIYVVEYFPDEQGRIIFVLHALGF